jgi:hypothetical protein
MKTPPSRVAGVIPYLQVLLETSSGFPLKSEFVQVAAQALCNLSDGFEVFRRKGVDKEAADQPEMRR